jgi:hypothetical protein
MVHGAERELKGLEKLEKLKELKELKELKGLICISPLLGGASGELKQTLR